MQSLQSVVRSPSWSYKPSADPLVANNMLQIKLSYSRQKNMLTYVCTGDSVLRNTDTEFLDDRMLVRLAIELGVCDTRDLPDLRTVTKDLI